MYLRIAKPFGRTVGAYSNYLGAVGELRSAEERIREGEKRGQNELVFNTDYGESPKCLR